MHEFRSESSDPEEVARQICARASQDGKPVTAYVGTIAMLAKPGQSSEVLVAKFRGEEQRRRIWDDDRRKAIRDNDSERRNDPSP